MTFCAEKLVHLDMSGSLIEKLWDGLQELGSLKEIKLARCEKLIELPNFSKASKLRVVNLSYCRSLRCIHSSLLSLQSLSKLNLDWCTNLKSLHSEIPLDNLVLLFLSYCSSLREFSLSSVKMQVLDLSETAVEALPSSIRRCSNLKNLFLNNLLIKGLPNELSNLQSLVRLDISGCTELGTSNLHIIFDGLCSLHDLILERTNVKSLPDCIKNLSSLEYIGISNCKRLQSLPELPLSLKRLVANDCSSLKRVITPTTLNSCKTVLDKPFGMSFRNCMKLDDSSLHAIATDAHRRIKLVAKCHCDHCIGFCFPGNRVPSWFTHRNQSRITIELPSRSDLWGFAFCVVLSLDFLSYEEGKYSKSPSIKIQCQCCLDIDKIVARTYTMICPRDRKRILLPDHVILWYDETDSETMMKATKDSIAKYNSHNSRLSFMFSVEVAYCEGSQVLSDAIKECGVWPIYASECDYPEEEMEVLGLGNKTNKCEDMDRSSKNLKPFVLSKGMELEFEASTSEIGIKGCELEEFIFQPLPTDFCMQNERKDLTDMNFNHLLNREADEQQQRRIPEQLQQQPQRRPVILDLNLPPPLVESERRLLKPVKKPHKSLEAADEQQQRRILEQLQQQPQRPPAYSLDITPPSPPPNLMLDTQVPPPSSSPSPPELQRRMLGAIIEQTHPKIQPQLQLHQQLPPSLSLLHQQLPPSLSLLQQQLPPELQLQHQQLPPPPSKIASDSQGLIRMLLNEQDNTKKARRVLSVSEDVSEFHSSVNLTESYLKLELGSDQKSKSSDFWGDADEQPRTDTVMDIFSDQAGPSSQNFISYL